MASPPAPDGALYITGKFEQRTTIGGTELTSSGAADIPLARVEPDGKVAFVRRFGGPGEDNMFDIDADEQGAVATGIIAGTIEFGDHSLTAVGSIDCVVAAFDPPGSI